MFVKPDAIPVATPSPFNASHSGGIAGGGGNGAGYMTGTASRSSRGAQSFNRKKSRVESGLVSSLEVITLHDHIIK